MYFYPYLGGLFSLYILPCLPVGLPAAARTRKGTHLCVHPWDGREFLGLPIRNLAGFPRTNGETSLSFALLANA